MKKLTKAFLVALIVVLLSGCAGGVIIGAVGGAAGYRWHEKQVERHEHGKADHYHR